MKRMISVTRQFSVWKPWQLALLILVSHALPLTAQAQNAQRQFVSMKQVSQQLEVITSDGQYIFKPYASNIIETSFVPQGEAIISLSHAVVLQPASVKTHLRENRDEIVFVAGDMAVYIHKAPFQIRYTYKNKALISEKNGYRHTDEGELIDFNLDSQEILYGGGARALGMNRRGYRLPLYNKAHYGYEEHSEQMNFAIPLVYSSKIYGIHFDNPATGQLDLDSQKNNVLSYQVISGRKTYQVIAGDNWEQLVSSYTSLTGKQPLPARWTLGNFASRFGYHSEAEARNIVARYQAAQIPLDAIIFDLYWFGKDIKGTMGNLAFDRDNFPQPEKMIADFAQQGVKTVLITEPFILTSSAKWKEAVDQHVLATGKDGLPYQYDFYFGHTGLIDIFNPHARDWFWNIYRQLKQQGVTGWWGDLGEPEVHPSGLQHTGGSADELHNIYGHEWAKLIADGYRKDYPQERPFILMRAGYSGSQRFGMIPWSGDVNRTWGGLRSQPEIALQMGMQGMAYMHSDLGGFAGANLDDELYARWLQYGVFQPIFRPHAQEEVASEPVLRTAPVQALAKAAIELRYRMLPYNYTLAFDNHRFGTPLMRPLFFNEPDNSALQTSSASYLWGENFLVQPVLQAGQQRAEMYFPGQQNWFDFFTDQVYAGGSKTMLTLVPEHIPVFVKAGAFVPLSRNLQNTRDYRVNTLELHYYHDAGVSNASGHLFDDDGTTADAYEHGAYALMHFHSQYMAQKRQLTLTLDTEYGHAYARQDRAWTLVLHHVNSKPSQVRAGGHDLAFQWDQQHQLLTIPLQWKAGQRAELNVRW